jgi:tetratricopeptide (TPR) repeat protein
LILLAALVFAGNLFAADVAADFSAANRLYAEGKFSGAANAYEKILQTGWQSSALLFNYANAEYKAGNPGRAIAAYRRAGQLSPRDSEIRANLDFVRNQVQGPTVRESRWQGWLGQLTLNEWALLAAGAFWLTFLLLAAGQIVVARASRPSDEKLKHTGGTPVPLLLRRAISVLALLTVFSGAALALQAANHFSRATAVVISAEATARSGPFDEAQSAFTAHDGAELSVQDRHGGWIQAADGSGKIGWLPVKQVEVLPGA